jgi:hypothetical protein
LDPDPRTVRREAAWLLCLAVLALAPRLAYVTAFPHRQFLDFRSQVEFAEEFNDRAFAAGSGRWANVGPGLALGLSVVLRAVPGPPLDVARDTTAILTGLTALLPFVLWRGALSLRARVTASLLLALWPGHIVFSGVVSQDNWVLPPAIALAALAVRTLARGDAGHPVVAPILYCVAGAVRPDMFIVLLPLLVPAAGLFRPLREWRPRAVMLFIATMTLGLVVLGGCRWAGSGRFRLTPSHAGIGTLGAYIPGAGVAWAPTNAYFAAAAPQLVPSDTEMRRAAWGFVWRELRRRPAFHLVRSFANTATSLLSSDTEGLFWSVGFDNALPDAIRPRAERFAAKVQGPIAWSTTLALSLCLGAAFLAVRRRLWPILLIVMAVAVKIAVHAVVAAQGRYFVVVLAFAFLVIALAVEEAQRRPLGWGAAGAVALALALVLGLRVAGEKAVAHVISHQEQLTYRFTLRDPGRAARMDCVVRQGLVSLLWASQARAAIRLLDIEPARGDSAVAECDVESLRESAVDVLVSDSYRPGGFPGRIVQSVTVDGRDALRRDVADEEANTWARIPLGTLRPGERRRVVFRMTAGNVEAGWLWGSVNTELRIAVAGD